LFRSTSKVNNKSELLVFISPKIIKDAMSLR
jgi:type II secretory pathway component GspD/PulD (secretin)